MTGNQVELIKLGVALLIFVAGGLGWWIRRSVERRNATRALLIEIEQINVAIQKRYAWWTTYAKKDLDAGMTPEPLSDFFAPAYEHLADKLPLLKPKVARKTVKFHGYRQFINAIHGMRAKFERTRGDKAFYEKYANTLDDHLRERGNERDAELRELFEQYNVPLEPTVPAKQPQITPKPLATVVESTQEPGPPDSSTPVLGPAK